MMNCEEKKPNVMLYTIAITTEEARNLRVMLLGLNSGWLNQDERKLHSSLLDRLRRIYAPAGS